MDLSNQDAGGDVEDRRGNTGKLAAGGGIGALVLAAIGYFVLGDPNALKNLVPAGGGAGQQQQGEAPKDGYKEFSSKILQSTNKVWDEQFEKHSSKGQRYEHPAMVLFSHEVDSGGCGVAPSAVGPFYCPVSKKVFLDPTFFEELEGKLGGSKAQFSQAYVIGHEVGHHVQNLLGYNKKVDEFERLDGKKNAGIRLELQADYLAGVWTHYAKDPLKIDTSDVNAALKTAQAIGDDRIQKKMQGWVSPEGFTHGTAAQRLKYFQQGLQTGDASKKALDHFFDRGIKALDL
jgi:predicted metalloprotease